MRIRNNAKLSPLVYPASSSNAGAVVQTHVCQLNQSPWDVMSFSLPSSPPPPPPPPPQVNKNDVSAGNEYSLDNVPVVERKSNPDWKCEYIDGGTTDRTMEMVEQPHVVEDELVIILCCKTDGKSWQCPKNAAKGNSLCEHHLSLAKNYNNLNQSKKSEKSVVEAQRRPRPKKASASSSSSLYEYYYYSGFGPSWVKKRGESSKNTGGNMSQNFEHKHELNPSLLSQFDDDDTDSLDDDEDEYEIGEKGKKRGRKPMKARSLKSLI